MATSAELPLLRVTVALPEPTETHLQDLTKDSIAMEGESVEPW